MAYAQTDRTFIVRLADGGSHVEASPKFGTIGRLLGVSAGPGGTAWAVGLLLPVELRHHLRARPGAGTALERDLLDRRVSSGQR